MVAERPAGAPQADVAELVERARQPTAAVARLISLVEDAGPALREVAAR